MSQADIGNISAGQTGPDFFDNKLEPWRNALHSGHSGTSRPSYVLAGMTWLDTTTNPWVEKLFDGTDDITKGFIDITLNTYTAANAGAPYTAPTTAVGASIALAEGTTNGTNTASLKAGDNLASSVVLEATVAGNIVTGAGAQTLTNKTIDLANNTVTMTLAQLNTAITDGDVGFMSNWVSYTPTFTGFGTPSAAAFFSRRNGNNLEIRGDFTIGTSTAVEGRVTVGFNGTNAPPGLVTDSGVISGAARMVGSGAYAAAGASNAIVLAESGLGYMTFGLQASGTAGLVKQNGTTLGSSGTRLGFTASIPVTGW